MEMAFSILMALLFEDYDATIVSSVLLIIGMVAVFKKCGVPVWWAFVPCGKYYMLSVCAGREPEGSKLTVTTLLITVFNLFTYLSQGQFTPMALSVVLAATLEVIKYIYLIRVLLGLLEVFGSKKRWIILALINPALLLLLLGLSRKRQPLWQVSELRSQVAALSGASAAVMDNGLTVNLEERSVREFLTKKYLLRDIHMYVPPGHMVLLLGGSGAGKTTFLNAVNGYERAKARISLNGRDVYSQYKQMMYEIGFVPQQDLMRGSDTVERTLSDAALLRLSVDIPSSRRKERVEEVMGIFGLLPVRNSLVEKLSGGQRKRLSIAMEFISNPSLFILDEPDSGLDGVMARELMQQLRTIANQGKIVIVITHTPDRVIDLFDDVIVLAKDESRTGRLAYYGSIDNAKAFFGKNTMEQIVRTVNREEEGGEGRADEFITKYAEVQHV